MQGYTTDDLIRLAAAGGGFAIDAQRFQTNDLIRIAAAAGVKGSRITVTRANMPINDLLRIAAAGKGAVTFET